MEVIINDDNLTQYKVIVVLFFPSPHCGFIFKFLYYYIVDRSWVFNKSLLKKLLLINQYEITSQN